MFGRLVKKLAAKHGYVKTPSTPRSAAPSPFRKIAAGHYHYTNPAGQVFWIARVEVLHGPYRVEWQVGEVVGGVEQTPFDQALTRALCVAYCQPEE